VFFSFRRQRLTVKKVARCQVPQLLYAAIQQDLVLHDCWPSSCIHWICTPLPERICGSTILEKADNNSYYEEIFEKRLWSLPIRLAAGPGAGKISP